MPFRFNLVAHNLQKFDLTYNQYLKSNSIDLNGQTSYAKEAGFGEKVIRHLSVGTELVLGPWVWGFVWLQPPAPQGVGPRSH
jgi:hypothetical protein